MSTRKKYKLKPDAFLYLAVIIVLIILANKGCTMIKNHKYHQTTEYKLITNGYSKSDIKVLSKYLSEKELISLSKKKKDTKLISLMKNKNYKHKNYNDYLEYMDLNHDKTIDEIIHTVNLHLNYDFYEDTKATDLSKNTLILVNKYNSLSEDYIPDDLVVITTKYSWGTNGSQKIRNDAFNQFVKMHEDAEASDIYLMVGLSFRTYEKQSQVYKSYKNLYGEAAADKIAARAGFSEHQTGLALDIFSLKDSLQDTFKDSDTYAWLKENSYKYGFILRYPEGKEKITGFTFEPWHYRYVGVEDAKKIHDLDITFEEYYINYIEK